jgi:hypothetical protein
MDMFHSQDFAITVLLIIWWVVYKLIIQTMMYMQVRDLAIARATTLTMMRCVTGRDIQCTSNWALQMRCLYTAAREIAYDRLLSDLGLQRCCNDKSALTLNASIHEGTLATFSDNTTDVFQMIHSSNETHSHTPTDMKLTFGGKSILNWIGLLAEKHCMAEVYPVAISTIPSSKTHIDHR